MKKAVLVGCSEYVNLDNLECVRHDLEKMGEALSSIGFEVTILENKTFMQIMAFFMQYQLPYSQDTERIFLLYFSGHGCVIDSKSYFAASDYDSEQGNVVDIQFLISKLRTDWKRIVFVDTCRVPISISSKYINSKYKEYKDCYIGYSTLLNEYSYTNGNTMSKFTQALVANIIIPGLSIHEIFQSTKRYLSTICRAVEQYPIALDSLTKDICLCKEDFSQYSTMEEFYALGKKYIEFSKRKDNDIRQKLVDIGVKYIRKAADMGMDDAKFDMAYFCTDNTYLLQYGKLVDFELGLEYYSSISQNRGRTLYGMAENIFGKKYPGNNLYSLEKEEELLLESFEKHHYLDAAHSLGWLNAQRGKYDKAFSYFLICAEAKMCLDLFIVGSYYEKGLYINEDKNKAIQYYEKAYIAWKRDTEVCLDFDDYVAIYRLSEYYTQIGRVSEAEEIINLLKKDLVLDEVLETVNSSTAEEE